MAWEMTWPIGVVLLGLALAWGAVRYHIRNKANDRITEEATYELRKHPETYDEKAEELKRRLKP